MRVLVYPHEMLLGGAPLNAIDLATAIRDRGHDVIVYGPGGPLVDLLHERGLRYVAAHPLKYRPGPPRIQQLRRVVRDQKVDLVHGYEWPPCLDAYLGAHVVDGVPLVCTILSMHLSPLVPGSVPLVTGTKQLSAAARSIRPGPVSTIEPPVDIEGDDPGRDGMAFRRSLGIGDDEILVVSVSRLSLDLKLDALCQAVDAAGLLADGAPVRVVLVGDGPAAEQLRRRAAVVNRAAGRPVVLLPGPYSDPRDAYAAADVVIGMGGSALRGMAFAKPVVVQGEAGFAEVFEPSTERMFLHQGFFGHGRAADQPQRLAQQLATLVNAPDRRNDLGQFGRSTVVHKLSLTTAATKLEAVYEATLRSGVDRRGLRGEIPGVLWRAIGNEARLHDPRDKRSRRRDEVTRLRAAATYGASVAPAG